MRQGRPFSESRASFLVAAAPRCERCRLLLILFNDRLHIRLLPVGYHLQRQAADSPAGKLGKQQAL
jgi:hypothetical protein